MSQYVERVISIWQCACIQFANVCSAYNVRERVQRIYGFRSDLNCENVWVEPCKPRLLGFECAYQRSGEKTSVLECSY